jgi:hypothetical protein
MLYLLAIAPVIRRAFSKYQRALKAVSVILPEPAYDGGRVNLPPFKKGETGCPIHS